MTDTYWIGKAFAAEWTLTDPTSGSAITGVTHTGTVTRPDGTTTSMTVTELGAGKYRAVYEPTAAGRHAYRVVTTSTVDWATEGTFGVHTTLTGATPITTDPTTELGMIRTLATDLDEIEPLFTDAQLQALLDLESSVRAAAALALETIAVSEVLIAKKIRTLDLQTDGPAVAKELRERAAQLRAQQKTADDAAAADADTFTFDIIDFDPYYTGDVAC